MQKLLCCFILFILLMAQAAYADVAIDKNVNFLVLSDIHFDPFVGCQRVTPCPLIQKLRHAPAKEWPLILKADGAEQLQYHQDTTFKLLNSALAAAKQIAEQKQIKFVMILGDFLGHDYRSFYQRYAGDRSMDGYLAFVHKTMEFLTTEINAAFPNVSVYQAVGNNDSYQDDYVSNPGGAFFRDMSEIWGGLIKDPSQRAEMQREFIAAGYYSVELKNPANVRLIMLNTNLFSDHARGHGIKRAAAVELEWLQDQLQRAKERKQKVLIGMHIPLGVDVYATLRTRLFTLVDFWKLSFAARFRAELEQYAFEIDGIFAGHLHSDWFQILTFKNGAEIPMTGTPSISPIFGNNPGFKVFVFSTETEKLANFETYYYPFKNSPIWGMEYDFNRIYQAQCQECSITKSMRQMQEQKSLALFYKKFYTVSTTSEPISSNWYPYYWCAIWENKNSDYEHCLHRS